MLKLKKLLVMVPVVAAILVLSSAFAYAVEGDKIGISTGDSVNVRQSPNLSSEVVSQLSKGEKVNIVETSGDWYKISYSDVNGWVFHDYLSIRDAEIGSGTISGDGVNLRAKPDIKSEIITVLSEGEKFSVNARSGDWYKVKLSEGSFGWVNKDYIVVRDTSVSRGAAQDAAVKAADGGAPEDKTLQQKIVEYAKKYLGVKYVYGGTSPKGFDCSGFVQYVFKNFSIGLERVAASQAANGTKVNKADLKTGDLVFFDTNGGHNSIEHVGIYIGNGQFIHASSGRTSRKVIISDLTSGFYDDAYMSARRYIK